MKDTQRLLREWDASIPAHQYHRHERLLSRRELLRNCALGALAAAVPHTLFAASDELDEIAAVVGWQHQEPWRTLAVVQEHLFPSETNSPGAREINALAYLRSILDQPHTDPEDASFIRRGVGWLDEIAIEQKQQPFRKLDGGEREQVLRSIERSRAGENWLALLLMYIFEALLSDPVYGGNPQGVGWDWLEHQPGFPRPPIDKLFHKP